jgi:hypothetical protein
MPVAWESHTAARRRSGLEPLDNTTRNAIVGMVVALLRLPEAVAAGQWGAALGYGLYAAAVIYVPGTIPHPFRPICPDVAVKVYRSEMAAFVAFQQEWGWEQRFDGLQRTLAAGLRPDGRGLARGYAVLQYVEGQPLDVYLAQSAPLPARQARIIVERFFGDLLIPLWANGHRFWDYRHANLIIDPSGQRLTMIDTDALAVSARELTGNAACWTERDKQERKALGSGLLRFLEPLLAPHGASRAQVRGQICAAIEAAGLATALHSLGRPPRQKQGLTAAVALDRFLHGMESRHLL